METLDRLADRVAQALALIGAIGVIALLLHVGIDVITRNLLGRPIPATNEIVSRYYMVLIAFLPLAWVERAGAMISVEVLEGMLPRAALRLSDALVAILATLVYAGIAWVTWGDAVKNWRTGSFVDVLGMTIPVWPTYFLPPAGFALAASITALRAVRGGRA